MATTSLWFGILAITLGGSVATWGAVTRVRRRVLLGAATITATLLLLVGLPLVDVTRRGLENGVAGGAAIWLVIGGLGLVAIVVAAFLEQGRRRVRAAVGRWHEVTHDWE